MDKKQTTTLLMLLNTLYPKYEIKDPSKLDMAINVWCDMLGHEPYDLVLAAVKKLAYESQYPPTIADISKRIAEIKNPDVTTDAEAWGEVLKAISNHGVYDIEKALDSMSEFTRKVVNTIGFKEICQSENQDTLRAQFRMAYNSMAQRKKQDELIPDDLRRRIQGIGKEMRQLNG